MAEQLPGKDEIFLDHVGWYLPDLDQAGAAFERLGFTLTPYAVHGDRDPATGEVVPTGSANRLVILERGYLELLTDVAGTDTLLARHLRERTARYQGIHLTALTVADAAAEAARLGALDIPLQPVVNLRRKAEAEDGTEADVGFTVLRPPFDLYPEGRIQTLTHLTPEQVWQKRYIARENGIQGLAELIFSVPDPAASAGRLTKFTGRAAVEIDGGMGVDLDRGRLSFLNPESIALQLGFAPKPPAPAVAAVGFVSSDLAKTRDFFAGRGIELVRDEAECLVVAPEDAVGAALVIEGDSFT